MASEKPVFDSVERQWLLKSIDTQRGVLVRSLNKEMPGSDIYRLRQAEISSLDSLKLKVSV